MNAQCSPEPYRLTADGRLEKSGLYHQMKSFKTKPIEDIITSLMEKGVLPTIKDYNNILKIPEILLSMRIRQF